MAFAPLPSFSVGVVALAVIGGCSLAVVGSDKAEITIDWALVRRTRKEVDADALALPAGGNHGGQESPNPGVKATLPVPGALWRRREAFADQAPVDQRLVNQAPVDQRLVNQPMPMRTGWLLLWRSIYTSGDTQGIGKVDMTNFHRDVWAPTRKAAGQVGDESLPQLAQCWGMAPGCSNSRCGPYTAAGHKKHGAAH